MSWFFFVAAVIRFLFHTLALFALISFHILNIYTQERARERGELKKEHDYQINLSLRGHVKSVLYHIPLINASFFQY
jgi:uncharacterized membrane protein